MKQLKINKMENIIIRGITKFRDIELRDNEDGTIDIIQNSHIHELDKRNIKLLISQLILLDNETTNKTNPL